MSLHLYFLVRDELSAQDGLIFKGQRCVIPLSLRARIKEKLHGAHTGIQTVAFAGVEKLCIGQE